jgi:hypothetical protein
MDRGGRSLADDFEQGCHEKRSGSLATKQFGNRRNTMAQAAKPRNAVLRNSIRPGETRPRPAAKSSQAHPGVSPLHPVSHRNVSFQALPRPLGLPQFYEPYAHYDVPILSIPGNHDGEVDDPTAQTSLDGWVQYFMQAHPDVDAISKDAPRVQLNLPNVYWTLVTPFATIIGLYTNVPEGGSIDSV